MRLDLKCAWLQERTYADRCHWAIVGWNLRNTVYDFIKYKSRCFFTFSPQVKSSFSGQVLHWFRERRTPSQASPRRGVKQILPFGMACSCFRISNGGRTFKAVSWHFRKARTKDQNSVSGFGVSEILVPPVFFLLLCFWLWTSWCYGCKL